ncbi:MAG: hypothetical protein OEL87_01475, partial [Nanoarchaeota archaeon]|nr:hypothetical protein [Nanoarchaeota archaeon]
MKKFGALLFLLIILIGTIITAQEQPSTAVGAEDVEQIQGAIGNYSPLDESGQIDFEKYKPFKTKADERIEKINTYIGPITNVLWGVELSLSWLFIFSFIVWILLIDLIVMPTSEILNFNTLGSLFAATIIASLSMQGFGKNLAIWMDSLATQWWIAIITIFTTIIFGIIYSMIIKYLREI